MPNVQIPNVGVVAFPDDMPAEKIDAVIRNVIVPQAAAKTAGTPEAADPTAPQIEAPNLTESVGRGMMDVFQGAKQKYLNWTNPEEAAKYTADVNNDIRLYEKGRANGGETGVDWSRLAGNAAATSFLPGGGASAVGRAAIGAASGAAGGYLGFNPDNQGNAGRSALGGVFGAAVGALAPAVASKLLQATQSAKNKLLDTARSTLQDMIPEKTARSEITIALQQHGIDFGKLSKDVQESILTDARSHLQTAGNLNVEQIARKADIETVAGAGTATRAQVTRDPADWTQERQLQKVEANIPAVQRGESETLTGRLQAQGEAGKRYADEIGTTALGKAQPAASALEASHNAIQAIQSADKAAERATKELYDAYRAHGAENVSVPDVKVADELGRVADEVGVENIPPAVLSRLKSFGFLDGERTKLLTVNEADKLNRLINNNNPGHGPSALALGRIKTALNDSLQDIPREGAAKALLDARAAHSARMAAAESSRGVVRALDDVAPDKFLDQNVLGGSVRDLADLRKTLQGTPEGANAWNQLRQKAWDAIIERSTNKGLDPISGSTLHKQLEGVGKERLAVLFNPEEIAQIETLRRATLAMNRAPALSAVNNSNTTPALMGQALRLGNRIPGLGVFTSPIENTIEAAGQAKALQGALSSKTANEFARSRGQATTRRAVENWISDSRLLPAGIGLAPAVINSLAADKRR